MEAPPATRWRLFGHPLHAIFTHLPFGLLTVTVAWDTIGLVEGGAVWWSLSFWCMAGGLAAALLAAATGLADFSSIPNEHPAMSVALRHMTFMGSGATIFLVDIILRGGPAPPLGGMRAIAVILTFAGALLLAIGGWYGGEMVYGHGVGGPRRGDPRAERKDTSP